MAKKKKTLWQKIIGRLKRLFYQEETVSIVVKYLPEDCALPTDGPARYRSFTEADVPRFASGFRNLPDLFREWRDKYRGLVAELDGTPAACIWLTTRTKKNEGVPPFTFPIVLPEDGSGCYAFAHYILPEYRGTMAFFTLLDILEPLAKEQGCRYLIAAQSDPRLVAYYTKRRKAFVLGQLHFRRYLSCFMRKDFSVFDKVCEL